MERGLATPVSPGLAPIAAGRLPGANLCGRFPPPPAAAGVLSICQSKPPLSSLSSPAVWRSRRRLKTPMALMWTQDAVAWDVFSSALTSGVAFSLLRFWEELAKRGVFDQALGRKLVHISVGLTFISLWPMFSSGDVARFLAAVPAITNIVRTIPVGIGIWRNEAMVKSMSRHGDYRELLGGPLFYVCTITFATLFFWRTSPVAIAAICNLCAGDGMADIVGRRFGKVKLPYNPSKSIAGSVAMAVAGFVASIGYMYYFSMYGLMDVTWGNILGFLVVSLAATVVESLPISTNIDDNLSVPLTSFLLGSLIF